MRKDLELQVFLNRFESHAKTYVNRPKIFYLNEVCDIASHISQLSHFYLENIPKPD